MSLFQLISPLLGAPTVSLLLQSIFHRFLSDSFCLTFVSDSDNSLNFNINLSFTYITHKETVEELKNQLLVVSEKGCSDHIVNMRDPKMFMTAFDMVSKTGNIRRSDRKIIFLAHPEANFGMNYTLELFSMRETGFVANVLVILPNEDLQSECILYEIVTHKFGGSDAEANQPLYLDQWDSCTGKFKANTNLFPNNMRNLHGKTVKVAGFNYKPYMLLDLDTALTPTGRDGLELRIIEEFCRWVNCTLEVVREDEDEWGEVYSNGTGIGVIGSVVEDKADMGISALYSWYEEFVYLDFSAAGIRSAITCVTPSPRPLSSWLMPLMPFTSYMWYAVLITFMLTSVILVMANGSTDGVFLTVFGVLIAQSRYSAESTWRIRRVTGWLLMASLILVSAYGGGLASTFTVSKYEASIDTVQDLVDRNMEWGATHDAWIFSLTLSKEPLVKQLVSQFRIYSKEELKKRSFTRNMGFSIEKLPAGNFAIGEYLTQDALLDLTLMLEDFYYEQCVVMMRKSSAYTEKISALIGRLHQSGLLLIWETQVALKYLNFKVQQEVKLSRMRSEVGIVVPLSAQNVVGIFILYGIGVLLSIILFLLEKFTKVF